MSNQPVLSIIIPVYNGSKFIKRTLQSILSQPSADYEVIIIDDGSTDDSRLIIQNVAKEKKSIQLISTENHGVCHARNIGIDAAVGKYILFVDQDDIFFQGSYNDDLVARLNYYYSNNIDVFAFRFLKSNDTIERFFTSETAIQTQNDDHVYMISGLPIHFAFYHNKLFKEKQIRFMESKYIDLDMQVTHLLYYHSSRFVFDNNLLLYCWVIHQESSGHSGNNLIEKHYDAINCWKTLVENHLKNGDTIAANYCKAYLCGVYLWLLKEYYKIHLSDKYIHNFLTDLQADDIVSNYKRIDHQQTIDELDEYFNHKVIFIIKNRLEKYKRNVGLFAVHHMKIIKRKYLNIKYPYTIEDVKKLTTGAN